MADANSYYVCCCCNIKDFRETSESATLEAKDAGMEKESSNEEKSNDANIENDDDKKTGQEVQKEG